MILRKEVIRERLPTVAALRTRAWICVPLLQSEQVPAYER